MDISNHIRNNLKPLTKEQIFRFWITLLFGFLLLIVLAIHAYIMILKYQADAEKITKTVHEMYMNGQYPSKSKVDSYISNFKLSLARPLLLGAYKRALKIVG